MKPKVRQTFELLLFYVALPILFLVSNTHLPLVVVLSFFGIIFYGILRFGEEEFKLWQKNEDFKKDLKNVLSLFVFNAILLTAITYIFFQDTFLLIPKEYPHIVIPMILGYTLLSVIPQEILYRVYFDKRFGEMFPNPNIKILVGALLFSFGHIIFQNYVALLVTFFGGLILFYRYETTKSSMIVTIEHALYGSLIFCLGIGIHLISWT